MGKRKERDGIVLLNEHMLFAEEVLTKEERAELYDAVRAYSMEDVEPDMSFVRPEWRGIFRIMRKAQDKVIKRYDEACERNRIRVNKRWHGQMPAHTEDTEDTENTGYTGNTENAKQNKSNQNKTNQNNGSAGFSSFGDEDTGVTGVGWL